MLGLDNVEDFYPLAPMQQGMLFHKLASRSPAAYLQQVRFTLKGPLKVESLEQAWRAVLQRHPILRTFFVWENLPEPVQVVSRTVKLSCAFHDWSDFEEEYRRKRFQAFLLEDREKGFDLNQAPLMRLALFREQEQEHQFVWTFHHTLLDGWSVYRVLREVMMSYHSAGLEANTMIQEAPPYRDYVAWLHRQETEQAERFWRQELVGVTAPTLLAVGQGAGEPSLTSEEPRTTRFVLSSAASDRLRETARRHHLTLNAITQSAWGLLVSRYSGQRDVVFGAAVSTRPPDLKGSDEIVGVLINTLPVRVQIDPHRGAVSWLQELQERQAEARQHSHVPLARIQGWSQVPRGQPLFESILVFANYPVETSSWSGPNGLRIENFETWESSHYPLNAFVQPDSEIALGLIYDRQRLEEGTATRILGHWRTLLEGIAHRPDSRLSELPLLTPRERRETVVTWNEVAAVTRVPVRGASCLHEMFEAQVEQTPQAPAIVDRQGSLSYAELNQRANRIASQLREQGLGPEGVAAVLTERSSEMVAVLLAVLKTGGAYLPLDPAYPEDRLGFMIKDAKASVIVARRRFADRLGQTDAKQVDLDSMQHAEPDAEPCGNLRSSCDPGNLAYLMYTSGTTGTPKGVLVEHHNVVAMLTWAREVFSDKDFSASLAAASICFDYSVFEIFAPLVAGGTVILAEHALDTEAMSRSANLTMVNMVPSAMAEWCRASRLPSTIGTVNLGGEILHHSLVRRVYEEPGVRRVLNLYGPTENTVFATFGVIARNDTGMPAIGWPIRGTQAYILDSDLQPLPAGVPGELFLGGASLSRGYHNRPALTAEKFIPNPFGSKPGSRLYRTGDLACYREDGSIEYIGRRDQQVKIRGFRVEVLEVEAALCDHPYVGEALVLAQQDDIHETQLAAFVVAQVGCQASGSEVENWLRTKLPHHMIPSSLTVLDSFPRTANGKIDRESIAPLAKEKVVSTFVSPQDDLEKQIAEVWSELLGAKEVGRHDNFFDLGGHSLLLLQLNDRLRQATNQDVSIMEMMQFPTVSTMSRHLRDRSRGEDVVADDDDRRSGEERRRRLRSRRRPTG